MNTVWYKNNDKVLEVGRYAVERGYIKGVSELLYYFEKPWKYGNVYREFRAKEMIMMGKKNRGR